MQVLSAVRRLLKSFEECLFERLLFIVFDNTEIILELP